MSTTPNRNISTIFSAERSLAAASAATANHEEIVAAAEANMTVLPRAPSAPITDLMSLELDKVDDLYTIQQTTDPKNPATTSTSTSTSVAGTSPALDPTAGSTGRSVDFHFVDSGVAYGEHEKTSMAVNKRIQLDQSPKCLSCQWIDVPLIREGINFLGKYIVQ
jgi:hypothetical protein